MLEEGLNKLRKAMVNRDVQMRARGRSVIALMKRGSLVAGLLAWVYKVQSEIYQLPPFFLGNFLNVPHTFDSPWGINAFNQYGLYHGHS